MSAAASLRRRAVAAASGTMTSRGATMSRGATEPAVRDARRKDGVGANEKVVAATYTIAHSAGPQASRLRGTSDGSGGCEARRRHEGASLAMGAAPYRP